MVPDYIFGLFQLTYYNGDGDGRADVVKPLIVFSVNALVDGIWICCFMV